MELELEGELVVPLPTLLRQQRATGSEIDQRRGIGRRRLGALAGNEIELGDLLALLDRIDQRRAAIELIDDLEDFSSSSSGGVRAASNRPIRRCAAARSFSGMSA